MKLRNDNSAAATTPGPSPQASHHRRGRVAARLALLATGFTALLSIAGPAAANAFAIEPGSFKITPSTQQAGAHEDLTVAFKLVQNSAGEAGGNLKTTSVELPPGFIGNNTALPTCSDSELLAAGGVECSPASQVGTISFALSGFVEHPAPIPITIPLYNMEVTTPGIAAMFGFDLSGIISQTFSITVRPGDSGLTVTSEDLQGLLEVVETSVTVWGVPASYIHNEQRGQQCFFGNCFGGGEEANIPPEPYLSTPTSCPSQPLIATLRLNDWQNDEEVLEETNEILPMEECERIPFSPTIEAHPTTDSAESPTGLNVSLIVPQTWEIPNSISTSNLKDARFTLPAGFSLNPSAGSGLGSCTEAQLAREKFNSPPGAGCPPESKVGVVEIETPVLAEKAQGAVYVAKPFDNPFHSLLALYIVAKVPFRGVIVSVAGKVEADPLTGQLTTTFLNNPQVPFNKLTLRFRQGATSPLSSPPVCGPYSALADLTPYSAPLEPRHLAGNTFQIEHGVHGGPCPGGGLPPFHPGLTAGSINNAAGHYSPFYIRLSREDGEQEITHFSIKLPPGVIGKLAGIPLCSDAEIAQAKSREHEQGGALEEANPSCPAASEVGHTLVEAGVGSVLAQAPGKIYLAGPYRGSAISVVAITNAKVGPFDLGTVVVRFALKINPETGEVFVDSSGSDPLPHIVDGIPTHLRQVRIYMDRPEFVINPTSCERTSTASTVLGSGLNFVSEADDQPITVSSPFQAADCAALPFKPKLKLSLKGKTNRGGTPAFRAELTMKPGEANVGRAQVTLPKSEYLDNAHIGTVCTRVQFNQGAVPGEKCPAASVYGYARAFTPILSDPLEGPVYLRSSEHKLPDLVAALHNGEINIVLDGHIDSGKAGGIRNTFEAVPDAPVSKFVLEMDGGNKGLLENSTNLCAKPHRAIAAFTGQNGKISDFNPLLAVKCGKKGGGKGKRGKSHHARQPG